MLYVAPWRGRIRSRAGGKGPELLSLQIKNFRPLFLLPLTGSEPQFKEQGLQPIALGYSGVSRPRWGLWLRSDEVDPSASPYFYRWGLLFCWASARRRCNPWLRHSVLRSTPGGTLSLEGPTKLTKGMFTNN